MQKSSPFWLIGRAILAVLLTIGFYGLAIGITILLILIPYWEVVYWHRLDFRIAAGCLIGALAIIISIWPRADHFEPPGPRLTLRGHPELFLQIKSIAHAVKQRMPLEVYLLPDMNAFVTERGGFMGFGARRVMGLGLPLLQILTVSELRAVLAHEFGHFHGGDTALGPWIYKTRNAIIRTVEIVGSQNALLQLPFEGYAKLFLRITNSVSRQQEYSADQLAARVVGAKLLISGLSKIQKSGPAYTTYWQRDFIPALQAGYLLPLAQGFGMFMQAQTIVKATEKILAEALVKADTGPYDTHPPLPDRISALEKLPPGKSLSEEPAAISLLNDVQTFENKILQMMLVDKKAILTLKKLSWDDAVRTLYLPSWQTLTREHASIISRVKVSDLPEIYARAMEYLPALIAIGKVVKPGTPPELVPAGSVPKLLGSVFGCALAVKLEKLGWESSNAPGAPVIFRWEGVEIEPLNLFDQFANNLLSAEKWREICQVVKITDVELGEA